VENGFTQGSLKILTNDCPCSHSVNRINLVRGSTKLFEPWNSNFCAD